VKYLTLIALAACTFATGCMSYTERTVVQKPVPAQSTVYTTAPTTTTTSVSVN
jgi:hypothetical protein